MRILLIHANFIEFEATKKALKDAPEDIAKGKQRVDDCLVVLSAVEKRDEGDVSLLVSRYVSEIENVAMQVKAKTIVLYPYAHLSSQLSNPKVAQEVLILAEKELQGKYSVVRAPFGWYKAFTISSKGHPLSELSREFTCEEKNTLKRESKDEPFVFDERKLSEQEKILWNGAALLGVVIKEMYPQSEIGSIGFHQDQAYIDIANVKISHDELERVEKKFVELKEKLKAPCPIKSELSNKYAKQIAGDISSKAKPIQWGLVQFVPLFSDPLVSVSKIGALKITNVGSAYWKNNESNPQLARLYCVAFSTQKELDLYLQKQEEAHNRSHLKIGKEQGLFVVSELVGPGLPLLAPKGMIIRSELIKFLWELHKGKDYKQVWTPHIAKTDLYKTSGHWDKFGDELFKVKGKTDDFVMKPMNCPHHMQIYDAFSWSYRDLPVRFFEPATIYRDEKSGQLVGLSRVRAITQDDGHLFCRKSQIGQEVATIVGIVHRFYATLGMDKDYWVSLSVRGDDKSKYLGSDDVWQVAEASLEKAAKENKLPYRRREGEAAFYGPKLDYMFKDALGREWQLATIQCDFNLPERFNLSYMNEESKKERPVVIHRAISGSLERFMSILIEHFAGKFPLWLSPVQVKVVTITDKHLPFAQKIVSMLQEKDIRVELDSRTETMGKKVREAQLEKVNYIITIGDKEVEKNVLAVRNREGETQFDVSYEKFVKDVCEEVSRRSL